MSRPQADAFVFFGGTGNLAYKKIFPALPRLTRGGRLDSGDLRRTGGWNLDRKGTRREGVERHGIVDRTPSRNFPPSRYVGGGYDDPPPTRRSGGNWATRNTRSSIRDPSRAPARWSGDSRARCDQGARVVARTVRARRLRVRPGLTGFSTAASRENGSSGRPLSRQNSVQNLVYSASRILLEPIEPNTSVGPITMAEQFGLEGAGRTTTRPAIATWSRTTCCRCLERVDGAAGGERGRGSVGQQVRSLKPSRRSSGESRGSSGISQGNGVPPLDGDLRALRIELLVAMAGGGFFIRRGSFSPLNMVEVVVTLLVRPRSFSAACRISGGDPRGNTPVPSRTGPGEALGDDQAPGEWMRARGRAGQPPGRADEPEPTSSSWGTPAGRDVSGSRGRYFEEAGGT